MTSHEPPTFAVAVTFQIKPEFADRFRQRILQQAHDSMNKEPGCCQFSVTVDESNPATFFLYEAYVDGEAFVAHRQTPHFSDYDRTVAGWIESKQVRRLSVLKP
jgi:quinol monooxygenase YgiN